MGEKDQHRATAAQSKSHLSQRKYVSLADAAEYLGVSVATIRRMISAGEITGYRVHKRTLRVDMAEVAASVGVVPVAR